MKCDKNGNPLHTLPAMDLWGNKITYVDNVVFKKMLIQHGDMSGTWTAEQRKMIEQMGMKAD